MNMLKDCLERMHKFAIALRNAFHGPLIFNWNECRSCFLVVTSECIYLCIIIYVLYNIELLLLPNSIGVQF